MSLPSHARGAGLLGMLGALIGLGAPRSPRVPAGEDPHSHQRAGRPSDCNRRHPRSVSAVDERRARRKRQRQARKAFRRKARALRP